MFFFSHHLALKMGHTKKERIIFQASDIQGANMSCSFQGGVYMEETREVRLGLEGYEIFLRQGLVGYLVIFLLFCNHHLG